MLQSKLNTPDDIDYGYWVICDLEYPNECKDKTSNFQLVRLRREIENIEWGYKQWLPNHSRIRVINLNI